MDFAKLEISAVVIVRGGRILAVYNSSWGDFTLPMTKRRVWQDKRVQAVQLESVEHAAARAFVETIGKTATGLKPLPSHPSVFKQYDRNGEVTDVQITTFRHDLSPGIEPRADVMTEWLSVDEWLDSRRMPISTTAIHILKHAESEAKLVGKSFP